MRPFRSTLPTAIFALTFLTPALTHAQTQGASMPTTTQAAVIHRLYEECLNQNRLDLLGELVSANVVGHGPTGEQVGLAAFQQSTQRSQNLFPDRHFTIDDVISSGDKVAARWTMTATNTVPLGEIPPTGKRVTQHGIAIYRFEDGKIAETWLQLDLLGVLRQVGVQIPGLPAPAAPPTPQPTR